MPYVNDRNDDAELVGVFLDDDRAREPRHEAVESVVIELLETPRRDER
jgi:hypothetical protein